MPPIPCSHCGHNFMRHSTDGEVPRLCNNCSLRVSQTKKKEVPLKDVISVMIELPSKLHKQIEEKCINEGLSFSEYFLNLYENRESLNDSETEKNPDEFTEQNKNFKKKLKK